MQIIIITIAFLTLQSVNLPQGAQTLKIVRTADGQTHLVVLADPHQPIVARRLFMTLVPGQTSGAVHLPLAYVDCAIDPTSGVIRAFFIEQETPSVSK